LPHSGSSVWAMNP